MNKMIKCIIPLLLVVSVCWADNFENKPNIDSDKVLTEAEQKQVKEYLNKKDYFKKSYPLKNDYINKYNKGTVEYDTKRKNYTYQKIDVLNNTVFKGKNFSQAKPNTKAIKGLNHTFINCNLVNNYIDPTWKVINSNTRQIKKNISKVDKGETWIVTIEHLVFKKNKWELVEKEEVEVHKSSNYSKDLELLIQEQNK